MECARYLVLSKAGTLDSRQESQQEAPTLKLLSADSGRTLQTLAGRAAIPVWRVSPTSVVLGGFLLLVAGCGDSGKAPFCKGGGICPEGIVHVDGLPGDSSPLETDTGRPETRLEECAHPWDVCAPSLPDCGDGDKWTTDGCSDRPQSEFLVNSVSTGDQACPSVAVSPVGGFTVAWLSERADGADGDDGWDIRLRRFDPAGVPLSADENANPPEGSPDGCPSLAISPNGSSLLVWTEWDEVDPSKRIRARAYASDSEASGSVFLVSDYAETPAALPGTAALTDGTFVVVWRQRQDYEPAPEVYARLIGENGLPVGDSWPLTDGLDGYHEDPSVIALTDGMWVVVWKTTWTEEDGSMAAILNAQGEPMSQPFVIAQLDPSNEVESPIAFAFEGGTWGAVWRTTGPFAQAQYPQTLFFRKHQLDTLLGQSTTVFACSFTVIDCVSVRPAAAGFSGGRFVAAWAQKSKTIEACLCDEAGCQEPFSPSSFMNADESMPATASFNDDSFVLAWQSCPIESGAPSQDGSGCGIFAQRFNPDGSKKDK